MKKLCDYCRQRKKFIGRSKEDPSLMICKECLLQQEFERLKSSERRNKE